MGFFSFANILYNNNNNKIISGFIYNLSNENLFNNIVYNNFIVTQTFIVNLSLYKNSNIILPITGPYEMDSVYINLEGRLKFIKQVIKSFFGIYAD